MARPLGSGNGSVHVYRDHSRSGRTWSIDCLPKNSPVTHIPLRGALQSRRAPTPPYYCVQGTCYCRWSIHAWQSAGDQLFGWGAVEDLETLVGDHTDILDFHAILGPFVTEPSKATAFNGEGHILL